jgi:AraC-like DNA-binding protein
MTALVREASSIEDLVARTRECFLMRRRYAYFFVDPDLAGYFVWGRVVEEDASEGVRLFRAVARAGPSRFLADFSSLEDLAPDAAAVVGRSIARRLERRDAIDVRQAVVHPQSVAGATVAGFLSVFPPEHPHRSFSNRALALRWRERDDAAEANERIGAAVRARAELPQELLTLAAVLESDAGAGWTLARAARHLGIAKRTLQLRLEQAGTSFRAELAHARLVRAKALLSRTDDKLLAIAIEVGFASAQHFSRWFRAHTGLSPSEFRAQNLKP